MGFEKLSARLMLESRVEIGMGKPSPRPVLGTEVGMCGVANWVLATVNEWEVISREIPPQG